MSTETKNFFNIEEKYDHTLVIRDDKQVKLRKWKVKDRKNFKKLIEEKAENITPFELAAVLVFPCLEDKNILLSEEEIKYVLTELRSISISSDFNFTFMCQNEECSEMNTIKLDLKDVSKPVSSSWSAVTIDDIEIEFGEKCSPKFYYEKMYGAKTPEDRTLTDLALHIVRVGEYDGVIKFEEMMSQFEEMDTDFQDAIMSEYKKQKFTQDNLYECTCQKCNSKQTFIFDEIPDFLPKSWLE